MRTNSYPDDKKVVLSISCNSIFKCFFGSFDSLILSGLREVEILTFAQLAVLVQSGIWVVGKLQFYSILKRQPAQFLGTLCLYQYQYQSQYQYKYQYNTNTMVYHSKLCTFNDAAGKLSSIRQ